MCVCVLSPKDIFSHTTKLNLKLQSKGKLFPTKYLLNQKADSSAVVAGRLMAEWSG